MRITLTTHGGLTAGMKRPPRTFDVDTLDTASAEKVRRLADAAMQDRGSGSSRAVPDGMSYVITIDDGDRSTTLKGSDPVGESAFGDLLDYLEGLE